MRHFRTLLAGLLVAGTLGACASTQTTNGDEEDAPVTQEPGIAGQDFVLEVTNPMPHAMNVIYWVGGSQTTLGAVPANGTRTFQLPNRGDDSVRLTATDDAKTHTVDETLDLDPGQTIRWTIE
jgi:hypothetical protein